MPRPGGASSPIRWTSCARVLLIWPRPRRSGCYPPDASRRGSASTSWPGTVPMPLPIPASSRTRMTNCGRRATPRRRSGSRVPFLIPRPRRQLGARRSSRPGPLRTWAPRPRPGRRRGRRPARRRRPRSLPRMRRLLPPLRLLPERHCERPWSRSASRSSASTLSPATVRLKLLVLVSLPILQGSLGNGRRLDQAL